MENYVFTNGIFTFLNLDINAQIRFKYNKLKKMKHFKPSRKMILDLPADCFGEITNYLKEQEDVFKLLSTCKSFYEMLNDRLLNVCENVEFKPKDRVGLTGKTKPYVRRLFLSVWSYSPKVYLFYISERVTFLGVDCDTTYQFYQGRNINPFVGEMPENVKTLSLKLFPSIENVKQWKSIKRLKLQNCRNLDRVVWKGLDSFKIVYNISCCNEFCFTDIKLWRDFYSPFEIFHYVVIGELKYGVHVISHGESEKTRAKRWF